MEAAVKMAASAKAEMDKAKATVQEKAEKVITGNKEMAEARKQEKIHEANREKHEAGALDDTILPIEPQGHTTTTTATPP